MKNTKFIRDYERYYGKKYKPLEALKHLICSRNLRFIYFARMEEVTRRNSLLLRLVLNHYRQRYGMEMSLKRFGEGLVLAHPFNITINRGAIIGRNCTIYKNVTVGVIYSGTRRGVPTIKDNVVLCPGAFVAGGVTIGNDVLIAANAFVNFDVPDHSIVIGNPGVIKSKENATKDFYNR